MTRVAPFLFKNYYSQILTRRTQTHLEITVTGSINFFCFFFSFFFSLQKSKDFCVQLLTHDLSAESYDTLQRRARIFHRQSVTVSREHERATFIFYSR